MREYFDEELRDLNNEITEMSMLVEKAIRNTSKILANGQTDEGKTKAFDIEKKINRAENKIQNLCIRLLLHQAPVAGDLRYVSSALKMITDLERIGDQAVDIVEMSSYIKDRKSVINVTHILEMTDHAAEMVTMSIDAFVKKDVALAEQVKALDDTVDELFNKVKSETVEIIHRNSDYVDEALDLMMIAKYLERIGDHAVNIGEWVLFAQTGSRDL